jgi:hypothetical protein
MERLQRLGEGFLDEVLRFLPVARQPQRQPEHGVEVREYRGLEVSPVGIRRRAHVARHPLESAAVPAGRS